ncbi:MAG: hypothetical protein KDA58_04160 [Planctomycetaceae bacterium]|nr:hypothetical protein [Planctomycetaceae bacterium]
MFNRQQGYAESLSPRLPSLRRTWPATLVLFVTLTGCPNKPPAPDVPVEPVTPVEPAAPATIDEHAADEPLDLTPVLTEARQIVQQHGLPADWYQSLTADPQQDHSVLIMGIWTKVGPDVAHRFQEHFQTQNVPTSRVASQEISSDNRAFEELLYLLLKGEHPHEHVTWQLQMRSREVPLPSLNPELLSADGAVDFGAVHDRLVHQLAALLPRVVVNAEASSFDPGGQTCEIVCHWQSAAGLPQWSIEQLAWRPLIRVEYVTGERLVGDQLTSGERRLVLSCYAQVGFRSSAITDFEPISLAGPYQETPYLPTGEGMLSTETRTHVPMRRTCPEGQLTYADLASLNSGAVGDPFAAQQQLSNTPATIPNPDWATGSGTNDLLAMIHEQLDKVLRKEP